MSMDAKWYAGWIRLVPASTADEKMRNLEAADMLEDLGKRVPRWISVEERLPETQWPVIIALKRDGGGIRIAIGSRAHWTPHRYYIDGGSCAIDADRVTHWMPLPKTPEEDE